MQKLASFFEKSVDIVSEQTTLSLQDFVKDIETKSLDSDHDSPAKNVT